MQKKIMLTTSFSLATLVTVIGFSVMMSYLAPIHPIFQRSISTIPMPFNPALGFFLSGLALLLMQQGKKKIVFIITILIGLIGLLTLLEYLLQIDLKIDLLFYSNQHFDNRLFPGRMPPNAALTFVLISFCLALYQLPTKQNMKYFLGELFSLIIFTLGLLALIGYYFHFKTNWSIFDPMALSSSFAFTMWSISYFIWLIYEKKNTINRRSLLVPFVAFFSSLMLFIYLWQIQEIEGREQISLYTADKKQEIIEEIHHHSHLFLNAVHRVSLRWQLIDNNDTNKIWKTDSKSYFADFPFLVNLGIINEKKQVQSIYPPIYNFNLKNLEKSLRAC